MLKKSWERSRYRITKPNYLTYFWSNITYLLINSIQSYKIVSYLIRKLPKKSHERNIYITLSTNNYPIVISFLYQFKRWKSYYKFDHEIGQKSRVASITTSTAVSPLVSPDPWARWPREAREEALRWTGHTAVPHWTTGTRTHLPRIFFEPPLSSRPGTNGVQPRAKKVPGPV